MKESINYEALKLMEKYASGEKSIGKGIVTALPFELQVAGFKWVVTHKSSNGSLNAALIKEDCPYVLMFITSTKFNVEETLFVDKDVFEKYLRTNTVSLSRTHGTELRATVNFKAGEHAKRVYKLAMKGIDASIDHVSYNVNVCTREFLRPVTPAQNTYNRPYHTKVVEGTKRGTYKTSATYNLTEDEQEELRALGFKVKLSQGIYLVRKTYTDAEQMFADINMLENRFLGEYRYNPIKAVVSYTDFCLLIANKMKGVSDEVFLAAKKLALHDEILNADASFLCRYYGID